MKRSYRWRIMFCACFDISSWVPNGKWMRRLAESPGIIRGRGSCCFTKLPYLFLLFAGKVMRRREERSISGIYRSHAQFTTPISCTTFFIFHIFLFLHAHLLLRGNWYLSKTNYRALDTIGGRVEVCAVMDIFSS